MTYLASQVMQRILGHSGDVGYAVRDSWRDETTIPDSRYAEYQFRHFFGTMVTPFVFETAFRTVDSFYTMPLMAHALRLDDTLDIKSIEAVPALRQRLINSMVQADHYPMVGRMFEAVDAPHLPPAVREKAAPLARHLKKTLFYEHYLTDEALLPKAEERIVKSILRTHDIARKFIASLEKAKNEAPLRQALGELADSGSLASKPARDLVKGALETFHFRLNVDCKALENPAHEGNLRRFLEGLVSEGRLKPHHVEEFHRAVAMAHQAVQQPGVARDTLERVELAAMADDPALARLAPFVRDGLESRKVVRTLQRIQRTAFWPKMAASALLFFLVVGTLLLNFDAKRVQPWQKKLMAQGINPAPIVRAPSYLSVIPGMAVFSLLQSDRIAARLGLGKLAMFLDQRLGYAGRFAFSSVAGIGAIIATGATLIQRNLAKARATRPPAGIPAPMAHAQRNPFFAVFQQA